MQKFLVSAALVAAATLAAVPASATVIDFDNLASYTTGAYVEDGYVLSGNFYHSTTGRLFNAVAAGSSIDADGVSVVKASGAAVTFTLARQDGGLFEFGSIDFGKLTNVGNTYSSTLQFNFTLADDTVVTDYFTIIHGNPAPISTKVATFDGLGALKKFTFRGQSGGYQFDNIVVNDVAAAVPEPATWAMMLGGFGLIGGTMRRRRASVSVA